MPRYTANDASLAYTVHGSESSTSPPLLLIHGFPLDGRMWQRIIPLLERSYRLIVPDLRGFGESQPTRKASMARYADDVALLLDHLGHTSPVIVMGLSMGGYVAFEFMRRHGERLSAVILADTRVEPDTREAASGRRDDARRVLSEGTRFLIEKMLPKVFGPELDGTTRQAWFERMAAQPAEGVASALIALADRVDSTSTLGTFDKPVLIVVGADDAITTPAGGRAMAALNPRAHFVEIPGSGHVPPIEQPVAFASAVREFLESVSRK